MSIEPSKHPETYSELVVRSFKLYRHVLKSTFIFALLVSIVLFIPRLICVAIGKNVFLSPEGLNSQLFLFIAMYISTLWFLAAILWCINCIERKKHQNFIVDLKMAGKRILYILGAAVLIFFIGSFAGLFSYLLYIIFWEMDLYSYNHYLTGFLFFLVLLAEVGFSVCVTTLFYFYFPLIVIENDGIWLALKQSVLLVWKKIGRTLCLQLTPWLVYLITIIIIKMVFKVNLNVYFMPLDPSSSFFPTFLNIIVLALFIPWGSAMTLVQLRDLELRKTTALKRK